MNIKELVFHFTVAIATFVTGFAGYSVTRYFVSFLQPQTSGRASMEYVTPVACVSYDESPTPAAQLRTYKNEPFFATGEYYLFDEDVPAGFRDFEYFSIETHEYDETAEAENAWTPIRPKGAVQTRHTYKFKTLTLSPTYLAFETEVKDGISYRFVGRIRDENSMYKSENWEGPGEIRGKFMKVRNGEVIATIRAAYFGPSGC